MPREVFVAGQVLTAAELNVVSDQSVMVFAGTAARGSAIPSPTEGMVTYRSDDNTVEVFNGSAFVGVGAGGFTDSETITASDATWSVPTLASPIVKVTVIGGGGSGGGAFSTPNPGSVGGTSTFDAGSAGTVTATGGFAGRAAASTGDGASGMDGFAAGNFGQGATIVFGAGDIRTATEGGGGEITVAYLNLTGITTVDVTIGAGGAAPSGSTPGGAGGRGEVIVEYVAG